MRLGCASYFTFSIYHMAVKTITLNIKPIELISIKIACFTVFVYWL